MKLEEAMTTIRKKAGYRVGFEKREGGILASDYFPDTYEDTILSEAEAWHLAGLFAKAGKDEGIVNVYVIHGDDFTPVDGYKERELNIYEGG